MDDNAALRMDFILKVLDDVQLHDAYSLKACGVFSRLATILDLHGVLILGIKGIRYQFLINVLRNGC